MINMNMMTGNPKQPSMESAQRRREVWIEFQKQPLGGKVLKISIGIEYTLIDYPIYSN